MARACITAESNRKRSDSCTRYWDGKRQPRKQKNGYLTICIRNKKYYVHRMIAEQMLGRPLMPNEVVHHINGNKTDNRPENIEVLQRSDHARIHAIESGLGKRKGASVGNI